MYLSNIDFLKNGVPASIIAALVSLTPPVDHPLLISVQVVSTIGFLLMKLIG